MRILLIEDSHDLADWLTRLLSKDRYVVDCVHTAADANHALKTQEFALVLLDLGLPDGDGISVLKALRAYNRTTPVLILTANDGVSNRINGLDSGADDYLIKPIDINELEARIRAHMRRTYTDRSNNVSLGALTLDTVGRQFLLNSEVIALTPREHAVLEALLLRAGRPMQKQSLVESVFGYDDEANPAAIEIYVHRVRKKLEGSDVSIMTLRGLGYALVKTNPAVATP